MSDKAVQVDRSITGCVVSNKMDKTAVVLVNRRLKHPIYQKFITRSTRYKIHDPENVCQMGDIVEIKSCRPLSKGKSWMLVKVKEGSVA